MNTPPRTADRSDQVLWALCLGVTILVVVGAVALMLGVVLHNG